MSYGSIYPVTWWGNVNEPNGWGIVYPIDAGGSTFTVDTTFYRTDTTAYKTDQTQF